VESEGVVWVAVCAHATVVRARIRAIIFDFMIPISLRMSFVVRVFPLKYLWSLGEERGSGRENSDPQNGATQEGGVRKAGRHYRDTDASVECSIARLYRRAFQPGPIFLI
jgi:hypothetical protein